MKKLLSAGEILAIILFALVPVFLSFPYRINIFLSWEGAYRMAEGQIPFKDFGMPVGYMYWVIPAIFFKIFGAQLITLIKAQAFINILSGLAFRSIFVSLRVPYQARFIGVLVFVLSYSFPNYWPWYNHTVIVYQFISLAFLLKFLTGSQTRRSYFLLFLSAFFIFCSFFTKQDGGGLGLLICLALLVYEGISAKKWLPLGAFVGMVVVSALIIMLPVSGSGLSYWFNHGQPPHSSRISITDILGEFLKASFWIKFYLMMAILFLIVLMKNTKEFFADKYQVLLFFVTLGILAEASIFQVTSYVPEDNNFFFHSFGVVFLLTMLIRMLPIDINNTRNLLITTAAILLWWSNTYWNYLDRFILKTGQKEFATMEYQGYHYATEVNKNTFMIELDTTEIPMHEWSTPPLKAFERMLLPNPTVEGINRLMEMPLVKQAGIKVLNMTELTPLAKEIPFELETGSHYPLWYHKGVAMFDKETQMFVDRIAEGYYDLVLFEYIPYLNNFYPFAVREALEKHYQKVDSFTAPRKPTKYAWVEVYVKPRPSGNTIPEEGEISPE
jgi:hypothetical protein